MVNAYVAYSTASSTTGFTDISGYNNKIEPGEITREAGEVFTYSGDVAIIKSGKRKPLDIKFSFVYTEEATGPFKMIYDRAVAGSSIWVRWAPKGNASPNYQYTSDEGIITAFSFPKGDPDKGEPVMCDFTLKVPQVTEAAIAV
jgi:triacylglycerol esterase/lipase EstA (alpha/beta hydrolase family)